MWSYLSSRTGKTMRPNVLFVTLANEAYQATIAVAIPVQPPAAERRCPERVVVAVLPQACKQLRDTAVRKCQPENDREPLVADKPRVEEAQDEGRERKRGEAEGGGITNGWRHRGHYSPTFRCDTLSVRRRLANGRNGFHGIPPFR